MAITGKTGADAIMKTMNRQAIVYARYAPKLSAVIATMLAGGLLTAGEAAIANAYIAAIVSTKVVWKKIADYSGF